MPSGPGHSLHGCQLFGSRQCLIFSFWQHQRTATLLPTAVPSPLLESRRASRRLVRRPRPLSAPHLPSPLVPPARLRSARPAHRRLGQQAARLEQSLHLGGLEPLPPARLAPAARRPLASPAPPPLVPLALLVRPGGLAAVAVVVVGDEGSCCHWLLLPRALVLSAPQLPPCCSVWRVAIWRRLDLWPAQRARLWRR